MLHRAGPKRALPVPREGPQDRGDVSPDRLALRPWRAVTRGVLEIAEQLGIVQLFNWVVTDPRHKPRLLVPRRLQEASLVRVQPLDAVVGDEQQLAYLHARR